MRHGFSGNFCWMYHGGGVLQCWESLESLGDWIVRWCKSGGRCKDVNEGGAEIALGDAQEACALPSGMRRLLEWPCVPSRYWEVAQCCPSFISLRWPQWQGGDWMLRDGKHRDSKASPAVPSYLRTVAWVLQLRASARSRPAFGTPSAHRNPGRFRTPKGNYEEQNGQQSCHSLPTLRRIPSS